jgi:hypothetical protein
VGRAVEGLRKLTCPLISPNRSARGTSLTEVLWSRNFRASHDATLYTDDIPIDATIPTVYNSATQSQDDGIHENVLGHVSIGAHAAAQ